MNRPPLRAILSAGLIIAGLGSASSSLAGSRAVDCQFGAVDGLGDLLRFNPSQVGSQGGQVSWTVTWPDRKTQSSSVAITSLTALQNSYYRPYTAVTRWQPAERPNPHHPPACAAQLTVSSGFAAGGAAANQAPPAKRKVVNAQ